MTDFDNFDDLSDGSALLDGEIAGFEDLEPTLEFERRDELCLSCENWIKNEFFCTECVERSKQSLLIPEFDDLGVAG